MSTAGPASTDLVQRACAGDDAALAEVVSLYHDRVCRYGNAYCRADDLADAVQDTFLALTRSRRSFRGESSIGTWLYTTVRNACLQILRRAARQHRFLGHQMGDEVLADVAAPDLGPEQQVVRRDLAALVRDALGSLDPTHLEVLLLRDVECLSGSDTAARLGIGLPAMKSRLKRARTALREEVFERL